MSKVAIVILNFNGVEFLRKFLPNVLSQSPQAEVIVADNCSSDNSIEFLKHTHPTLRIILIPTNLGYAGGYNAALSQIDAEYFVLLNSDVEVTKNWLDPLIQFLDKNKDYAAVQPKILDFNNKTHFEYAGASGGHLDKLGYPYCRGRIFDSIEKDNGQYDSIQDVFWASGACLIIRSKDFNAIEGFDADFFAHMEEIDLCWRLNNAGRKLACIPTSVVFHVGGGTLNKTSPFKTYLNFRNNLIMLAKNLPLIELFTILPIRIILDLLAGIKFWKDQTSDHLIAVLKSQIDFIRRFPRAMRSRKSVQKRAQKSNFLVFEYFIRHKETYNQLNNTK